MSCRVPVVQTAGEFDHEPTDITSFRVNSTWGGVGMKVVDGGRFELPTSVLRRPKVSDVYCCTLNDFGQARCVIVDRSEQVFPLQARRGHATPIGARMLDSAWRVRASSLVPDRQELRFVDGTPGTSGRSWETWAWLLLRLRRFGDRGRWGVWVVLALRPDVATGVAAVVVDDGVLTGIIQQTPWFVTFRTTSNRHRERERDPIPNVTTT